MSGPLSGIRVVDFSRVLAGPLCARTLLELGAEVIKIEPPRPDVSRFAFPSTPGMSGYYAQQNAGKRNVSIDLNVPGARELALRLCDTADVVVENFRAGTLRYFGLDYETLAARNPRLIYASITGYGQGGPWQGRMAYAPTVQAEAGFTHNSIRHYGEALGEPRTDSLSHADVYAGLQAAIAILAALHRRAATGTGEYIDVAMAATLMAVNERAHVDLNGAELGAEPAILGATDCPFFVGPGGEHFTVATSLVGSRTFPSWLRAMRRADLADDPRFATAAARRSNFARAAATACPAARGASRASSSRHSVSLPFRASTTAPSLPSSASATNKSTAILPRARSSACQFPLLSPIILRRSVTIPSCFNGRLYAIG